MNAQFIILSLLGIVSLVYLSLLFFKPTVIQYVLKSCLIPLIMAVYLTGDNVILLPIVFALVFAWIGDVLLIKISNLLCFRLGLVSFLIGHICYIIAMSGFALPFNIPVLIISTLVAAGSGFFLYRIVKPTEDMRIPVIAYETIILVMAIFALQLFLAQGSNSNWAYFGLLVFTGSLCFVASDTALALVTFQKKKFYVFCMATYIAAQLLITLGFCTITNIL